MTHVTLVELSSHEATSIPPVEHPVTGGLGHPFELAGETTQVGEPHHAILVCLHDRVRGRAPTQTETRQKSRRGVASRGRPASTRHLREQYLGTLRRSRSIVWRWSGEPPSEDLNSPSLKPIPVISVPTTELHQRAVSAEVVLVSFAARPHPGHSHVAKAPPDC